MGSSKLLSGKVITVLAVVIVLAFVAILGYNNVTESIKSQVCRDCQPAGKFTAGTQNQGQPTSGATTGTTAAPCPPKSPESYPPDWWCAANSQPFVKCTPGSPCLMMGSNCVLPPKTAGDNVNVYPPVCMGNGIVSRNCDNTKTSCIERTPANCGGASPYCHYDKYDNPSQSTPICVEKCFNLGDACYFYDGSQGQCADCPYKPAISQPSCTKVGVDDRKTTVGCTGNGCTRSDTYCWATILADLLNNPYIKGGRLLQGWIPVDEGATHCWVDSITTLKGFPTGTSHHMCEYITKYVTCSLCPDSKTPRFVWWNANETLKICTDEATATLKYLQANQYPGAVISPNCVRITKNGRTLYLFGICAPPQQQQPA